MEQMQQREADAVTVFPRFQTTARRANINVSHSIKGLRMLTSSPLVQKNLVLLLLFENNLVLLACCKATS